MLSNCKIYAIMHAFKPHIVYRCDSIKTIEIIVYAYDRCMLSNLTSYIDVTVLKMLRYNICI